MVLSETGTKRIIQLDKNELLKVDNYRQSVYNKYSSVSNEHISTVSGQPIVQYLAKSGNFNLPQDLTWTWWCSLPSNTFVWNSWPQTAYIPANYNFIDNEHFYGSIVFNGGYYDWAIKQVDPDAEYTRIASNTSSLNVRGTVVGSTVYMTLFDAVGQTSTQSAFESNEFVVEGLTIGPSKGWYAI